MLSIDAFRTLLEQSTRDHKLEVMKCLTLHDAHAYCAVNRLSGQQYGPLLERYIRTKFKYSKPKASECAGDCAKNGTNTEVKVSLGGKTFTEFNYVQLRPSHACDAYLLTAYHLSEDTLASRGELYIFRVPKAEILEIIVSYGGYAHGTMREHGPITRESVSASDTKEYAIRPTFNDACWNALMPFRIEESDL
jgi:hypothetical protein